MTVSSKKTAAKKTATAVRAQYHRFPNGVWGCRVFGSAPAVGDVLTVTKRDGSTKEEIVSKVSWTGDDRFNPGQTCSLVMVAPKVATPPAQTAADVAKLIRAAIVATGLKGAALKTALKAAGL